MKTIMYIALILGYSNIIGLFLVANIIFYNEFPKIVLSLFGLFVYTERRNKFLNDFGYDTRKVFGRIWFAKKIKQNG
jgi:hypothetical protein